MKDSEFTITEDSYGSTAKFTLKGRVNAINSPEIQQKLERALKSGKTHIVVNMRHVEYLSSAGIRVLLSFYKTAKKSGGKFNVENPSESVRNVLGMTALDELLLK